ncbi:PPE family protein, partial [Mycobacterium sp.]|uniref:PPE family protein n=1 Tax=Mycobacterium sp. TaxID=1785 RepID=UPI003C76371E
MVFDFAARPPEINSALIYSGAGAGPLMAASSAFSGLSSELSSNAASYEAVINELGSQWQGPSSQAMSAAAQPYIGWLNTTSAQLQEAATQATASAAAYETAFAAVIPPPVIAANRATLAALVATTILGQNTPAIAANEAMYAEVWAQDAAAMYGYARASAAAATLSPLTPPAETTNPAGQGQQAAAVSNAVGSNGTSATLNNTLGSLQNAVSAAANPAASAAQDTPDSILTALNGLFGAPIVSNGIYNVGVTLAWNTAMMTATLPLLGHFMAAAPYGVVMGDTAPLGAGLGFGTTLAGATSPAGGAAMMAGMGGASSVGGLSVP